MFVHLGQQLYDLVVASDLWVNTLVPALSFLLPSALLLLLPGLGEDADELHKLLDFYLLEHEVVGQLTPQQMVCFQGGRDLYLLESVVHEVKVGGRDLVDLLKPYLHFEEGLSQREVIGGPYLLLEVRVLHSEKVLTERSIKIL